MRIHETRKFDMLRRVQKFMDDSAAKLGTVNATAARKELDGIVQDMRLSETAQATARLSARSATATQAALRRILRNHHMLPIATIAAAHLPTVPGFKAFQMPSTNVKVSVLVQDAIAMAEAARLHASVFVENGRPENFADALLAAAEAVRASIDARAASIGIKAQARDGLKATASRSRLVVGLLDAQVKSILTDDPKTLAGWRSAKRIGRGKMVKYPEPAGDQVQPV